jgi:hypothetical protein
MLCAVRALVVWGCVLAGAAVIAGAAGAKPADRAQCPLTTGLPSGGDVQWAFTETGPPGGHHPGISSSYTHGRGSWTSGRANGTVCSQDVLTRGPSRNLVLGVAGQATLTPKVTELGLLGVRLVLPVKVSATDDGTCQAGTRGTAALFASYFAVHRDSLSLHFAAQCADHDHLYSGPQLHVLIARDGAQVNSPSL